MSERQKSKDLVGAGPLDVFQQILRDHPEVAKVKLWPYFYKPVTFDEGKMEPKWLPSRHIFDEGKVQKIISKLPDGAQLAIYSKVKTDKGLVRHIPMMDFSLNKSPENLDLLKERLLYVNAGNGWIIESEKSYHFYGNRLLNEREWRDFMGNSLLTSVVHSRENIQEVADPRYVGYSLKRGGNTLRITSNADKTFSPVVVSSI